MSYVQVQIQCEPSAIEKLSAQLIEFGATGITENLDYFDAYFDANIFQKEDIIKYLSTINDSEIIHYSITDVEDTNWNELWESNYQPIEIDNLCYVYAPFHKLKVGFKHSILINPRMAFGTGHHETTFMMVQTIAELDVSDKTFLDLGCGTGILAIMASKENAKTVTAVDIDKIAIDTLEENFSVNNIDNVNYFVGTIDDISTTFDIIFANINKNVLLNDAEKIVQALQPNGFLALSGFYVDDNDDIIEHFTQFGVNFKSAKKRNNWSSIVFEKS